LCLLYQEKEWPYTTYRKGESPPRVEDEKTLNDRIDAALVKQKTKPAENHPWRQASVIAMAKSAGRFGTSPIP